MTPGAKKFSAVRHVPHYSLILLSILRSPAFLYLFLCGNAVLFVCAAGFYFVESPVNPNVRGFFDALWWGFVTITTVGYGDVAPMTTGGRLIAMLLMAFGVISFVGATALLMAGFFEQTKLEIEESEEIAKVEYEAIIAELRKINERLDRERPAAK